MADGRVVIISSIDSDGAQKGAKEIAKELERIAKESDETGEKIKDGVGGGFKEIFSATSLANMATDALKAIGQAALDMAKDAVKAAADVKASNAQFSQTFKGVEKQATEALENIAEETGITATRMQDAYTGIFAFTKSVGAEQEEALDISARAMQAAADSAAYYDKSIEEATETLQSFLKGNYENDAALGIAATETTRNAKANEMYAKSFQELSESQKVDVLLAMVEAGNQASGALGQAAREADSWTNVTGELEEAWRQTLAVLGDPILEGLTPILQGITKELNAFVEGTASQKIKKNLREISDSVENAKKSFDENVESIEANAAMSQYYIDRLYELENAGLETAEAQSEYQAVLDNLLALVPELSDAVNENTGRLIFNKLAVEDLIEAQQQQALVAVWQEQLNDTLALQAQYTAEARTATEELAAAQAEGAILMQEYASASGQLKTQFDDLGLAIDLTAMSELTATGSAIGLKSNLDELEESVNSNAEEQAALAAAIEEAEAAAASLDEDIGWLTEQIAQGEIAIEGLAEENEILAESEDTLAESVDGVRESLSTMMEEYLTTKDAARESIDSQIGYFDELKTSSDQTASDIVSNWEDQKAAFDQYRANLEAAVDMGLDETLIQQLSDGSEESMVILDTLVSDTELSVDDINAAFGGLSDSRDATAATMADIETDMTDALAAMKQTTTDEWGAMTAIVNEEIAAMQRAINSLQGKTVYVGIKPSTSTGTGGSTAYSATTQSLPAAASTYAMPYLATGAVIPPNAPFAAVLGDQRHGQNLEAPESLIRKIVREEAGTGGGSYRFTAQIDGRVLFDEMIEEAKRRQSQTGDDPFDIS